MGGEGRGNPWVRGQSAGKAGEVAKASKNRKLRDQRAAQAKAEFMEWAQDAVDDADEFLETATPFEISRTLAEIGVSTSYRAGIEDVLKRAADEFIKVGASPDEMVRGFLIQVVDQWKSELRAKGKSADMEDLVFLFQAAQHFTLNWVKDRMRADANESLQTPGLSKPTLRDFFPFKKPSVG